MTNSNFYIRFRAARALAELVLDSKLDKQGEPLFKHSVTVAFWCMNRNLSHNQIIAGMLHDCIEDGNGLLTRAAMHDLFGSEVSILVDYLTRPEQVSYREYLEAMVSECPAAIPIKLADLDHNLDESRGEIPTSLRERYIQARNYLLQHANPRQVRPPLSSC